MEDDFIGLVVAHARVTTWLSHALDTQHKSRQIQALNELAAAIKTSEAVADEAARSNAAPQLTRMLAVAADNDDAPLLDAIAGLLAALSGAAVHVPRQVVIDYPVIGRLTVREGALGDGVGARLWGISHRFSHFLIEHRALIEGRTVLELGSGVGTSGITAAKLGAHRVVLTDFVLPVLETLARNVHANLAHEQPEPGAARPVLDDEEDFSGAESVSDELDLLGEESTSDAGVRAACWDVGNVQVRCLDWQQDYESLQALDDGTQHPSAEPDLASREDDTTSALDCDQHRSQGSDAVGSRQPDATLSRGTPAMFDTRSTCAGMPPVLPPHERFAVVLACEVMYELLHAKWVAAVLKLRLRHGGLAIVIGAVRDANVYQAFEECLRYQGFQWVTERVLPVTGQQGLGNREGVYEDGYRQYFIEHQAHPSNDWRIGRDSTQKLEPCKQDV